jgi:hypothetical protein
MVALLGLVKGPALNSRRKTGFHRHWIRLQPTMLRALFLLGLLASQSALAADFTPEQRLASFPVPPGETVLRDIDFDQQPAFDFIKHHQDFVFGDPFLFQRARKAIPSHVFEYFLSEKAPRDLYLFYKRYLNQEAKKPDAERAQPFYNSRSTTSFDVKNEADISTQPDTENAVFYTLQAQGAKGMIIKITTAR